MQSTQEDPQMASSVVYITVNILIAVFIPDKLPCDCTTFAAQKNYFNVRVESLNICKSEKKIVISFAIT
jgi:hypothetical protein